jgi:F-type H+-transporting ATPase subunit epsilon
MMRLAVQTPVERVLDREVSGIVAEGLEGFFGLRPRHIDFVAALVPGLLYYQTGDGSEGYLAVDHGVLVKQGGKVMVSVRNAVCGEELKALLEVVETRFKLLDEQERVVRSAVARLEADFLRRFMELS